jgi:hypothetical protein
LGHNNEIGDTPPKAYSQLHELYRLATALEGATGELATTQQRAASGILGLTDSDDAGLKAYAEIFEKQLDPRWAKTKAEEPSVFSQKASGPMSGRQDPQVAHEEAPPLPKK